jgi:hypothetical protein
MRKMYQIQQTLVISMLALLFFACNSQSDNTGKEQTDNQQINHNQPADNTNLKLQVYYFHTTRRCPTCNGIQEKVESVLNTAFSKEMKEGFIRYAALNVDEKNNKTLAEKYEAYGSSLHVIKYDSGKETDVELTDFAFSNYARGSDSFAKAFQDTLKHYYNL